MRACVRRQPGSVSAGAESGVRPRRAGSVSSSDRLPTIAVPRLIADRYRVLRPLGRGGMGEVWLAEDGTTRAAVAAKLAVPREGNDQDVAASYLARFRFEAMVAARVAARTRRVPAVHDVVHTGDASYLIMEAVRGRTLRAEIDAHGTLEPGRVAALLEQIAEALEAAHSAGYAHCDLKPGNVLLRAGDGLDLKLIDFGCAQAISPSQETPPAPGADLRFGSPAYMSPEQLLAGKIDPRTDLWGLGVLAYEALTGRRPFAGGSGVELTMRILTKGFVPVTKLVPSLPKRLDAWFVRALSKKPSRRFETAAEAAKAFAAALAAPPLRRVPSPGKRPLLSGLRRAAPAAAVLALVAADAVMTVAGDVPRPLAASPLELVRGAVR